ncbi:MAG: methyltransferase domain-containing protein [Oligoflexia bacterium]|nr:methyltransferase domain-containing protein [Oligoflexia bacterium]
MTLSGVGIVADRKVLGPDEFFRKYEPVESRLTAALSERMLDLAGIGQGSRVLDLATGPGEPALRAAQRVAPDGSVVGLELDNQVLSLAREKARQAGISNLDIRLADATAAHQVPSNSFDAVTIRWGLMYMASPVAALLNAHQALLPRGVLVAALWAEPERVPYYTLPRDLLSRYRALPAIDPQAPGPFRYAELEQITRDFAVAGFSLDHVEEMQVTVFESESDAEMVEWVRAVGLTRLLNELSEDDQHAWERDLASELRRIAGKELLRLGGVTRIVRARRG